MITLIIVMPFLFAMFLLVLLYLTSKTRTRVHFYFNNAHWGDRDDLPRHGPTTWPFWRLVSFGWCVLELCKPSAGRRLWVYTRWGAIYFDVYFDRREQVES